MPSPQLDSRFRFRGKGMSGTATAGTSTNIDFQVTPTKWINGVKLILSNHVTGDFLDFQIVDVDNILGYGAGTVLDTFGETWYVAEDANDQGLIDLYLAKILSGLYIRIVYTSTGASNVSVFCNLFLHQESS